MPSFGRDTDIGKTPHTEEELLEKIKVGISILVDQDLDDTALGGKDDEED